MIALRIFEITFPIFAVVATGLVYGLRFKPDMTLPNRLNMGVFLPALLFSVLTDRTEPSSLFGPLALGATLVVLLSGLITWVVARAIRLSPATLCPPMMFANAGNLGLPLITLTFGESALAQAVILFIVCNFLHVTLGNYLLSHDSHIGRVLLSPMILATILALGLGFGGVEVPDVLMQPVRLLGDICVPLMLFALGVRLMDTDFSEWRIGVLVGLASPILGVTLVLLLSPWLQLTPVEQGALFLFGALPPAIMNYMFAEHYRQEPARVASMVLFGNALTVITLPLALYYVLPRFSPA